MSGHGCGGPSYSKVDADKAYEDVVKLLKDKYKQLEWQVDDFWRVHREEALSKLKSAVHQVFVQDSHESF